MVMAAIAITAGTVSCNKKEAMPAAENAGEKTEMTVNVDCGQFTKAGIVAENEKKVNNVQIFVFRRTANWTPMPAARPRAASKSAARPVKRTLSPS